MTVVQELYPGDLDRLAPHLEVAMNAFPCFQEAEIQVESGSIYILKPNQSNHKAVNIFKDFLWQKSQFRAWWTGRSLTPQTFSPWWDPPSFPTCGLLSDLDTELVGWIVFAEARLLSFQKQQWLQKHEPLSSSRWRSRKILGRLDLWGRSTLWTHRVWPTEVNFLTHWGENFEPMRWRFWTGASPFRTHWNKRAF